MNAENAAMLNAVQAVLRGLTVSLATAARVDLAELATLLQAAAANPALEPIAQRMLLDLAEGPQMLSGQRPQ
ncbi:MAG: hypothetical protein AB7K36_01230 [Chloroflexota bacterium]